MYSIGIFAGTFDPIHSGHIAFAQAAARYHSLQQTYFLPEAAPRHKPIATPLEHRLAMLHLSLEAYPDLHVLAPVHDYFTVEATLPWLCSKVGERFNLILGSDVARSLPHWPLVHQLLKHTRVTVGMRAGDTADELAAALHGVDRTRLHFLAAPHATARSRDLRQAGGQVDGQLPSVARYAAAHGLYL